MAQEDWPRRMDELLAFLPQLEVPGRAFVERWEGGERSAADGVMTARYPGYAADVEAFFRCASRSCWNDSGYDPVEAGAVIRDDGRIARATLDEIRTLLTLCVRSERFCDGAWDEALGTGRVQAVLRRLAVLRREGPSDESA
jgi:hypothetical protein